jgi:hypothetical protein
MSIASSVAAGVGRLRAPGVARPREVTVTRVIDAPLHIVRDACWDAARHGAIHALGDARVGTAAVRGVVAVGPVHHDYRAAIAGGPGALHWRGAASSGTVRLEASGRRTRVEVTIRWTPTAPWAHVAAGVDLDRRRIQADLGRVALIAESEAAEQRLGPIAV